MHVRKSLLRNVEIEISVLSGWEGGGTGNSRLKINFGFRGSE